MKSGFTLIELMLALFISSVMVLSLYQMLSQTRKGVARVTSIIDVDEPLMSLYAQLEKDITGMFSPHSALKPYIDQERKKKGSQSKEETATVEPGEQDPVLYLEHKGNNLWVSFITTGSLQAIDKEGKVISQPFVRRVAYILETDKNNADVYRIMYRYENDNYDLKALKAPNFSPSYEIANSIRNFSVEFTVYEETKDEKQKFQDQNAQASSLKEWKERDIWDKYKTLIPAYVTFRGTRIGTDKLEYPFEFSFKVYSYSQYKEPKEQQTTGNPIQDLDKWLKERGHLLAPGANP